MGWRARGLERGGLMALCMVASACVQPPAASPVARESVKPRVKASREAPRITSTFQSELTVVGSGPVTFRVVAEDPQSRALTISWAASTGTLAVPTREAAQSEVEWTPPVCLETGAAPAITATVTNARGLSATTTFTLTGGRTCLAGSGVRALESLTVTRGREPRAP